MTHFMSRHSKKAAVLSGFLALVLLCGVLFDFVPFRLNTRAEEQAQDTTAATAPAYTTDGWSQYAGASVTEAPEGMVMTSGTESGYYFSNTTKSSYALRELSLSFRVKDVVYDPASAVATTYIGFPSEDTDFMTATGSYGLAFTPMDATTYYVWFGTADPAATDVPGFRHILGTQVKVSDSGTVTVLVHRETDNRWMMIINGDYQIDLNGQTEINNALDAQSAAHVSLATKDAVAQTSAAQPLKLEMFQLGTDLLGSINKNYDAENWAALGSSTTVTEDGVVFANKKQEDTGYGIDIKAAVKQDLAGALDGAVISFDRAVTGCSSYSMDIGIGTFHSPGNGADRGRYTFWDSWNPIEPQAGSLGIRFTKDPGVTYLMLPRQATEGFAGAQPALIGGDSGLNVYIPDSFTMQFMKVDGNWKVLINGRKMGGNDANFQNALNQTLESINAASGVFPWISFGDVTGKSNYSAEVTMSGIGTRRWCKAPDPAAGVLGDEITGTLEFHKDDWINITPSPNVIDVRVDNETGFVLKGRSVQYGWNIGMNYLCDIGELDEYAVTLKPSDTVLASQGSTYGYYGMFVGDKTRTNFSEMRSIYVRWYYASADPTANRIAEVIVWDHNSGGWKAQCATAFPAKDIAGKESEVTVRFVYSEEDGVYRVYANGVRISNGDVEAAMTALVPQMSAKYVSFLASYETQGVGSAWSSDATDMQEMTLVSLGGKKPVNASPEVVENAFALEGKADSESQVTLTWHKAVYSDSEMDYHNFTPVGYKIERVKGTETEIDKTIMVEGDMDTLTYVDTGLDASTYYFYTVYAVDANGQALMVSNRNERVKTSAIPETDAPTAPETDAPIEPETNAPETNAPETNAPETDAPTAPSEDTTEDETAASPLDTTANGTIAGGTASSSETDGDKADDGCGSVVGASLIGLMTAAVMGAIVLRRREDLD